MSKSSLARDGGNVRRARTVSKWLPAPSSKLLWGPLTKKKLDVSRCDGYGDAVVQPSSREAALEKVLREDATDMEAPIGQHHLIHSPYLATQMLSIAGEMTETAR